MFLIRILLFPFAVLYDAATRVRNFLYDTGRQPSVTFDLPVIGVGNLTAGGTGKTPMVEFLIRLLSATNKIGVLSRGYGRKTRGFRLAAPADTPVTLGDEPYQLAEKFSPGVAVAVGEDRALSIPLMVHEHPDLSVVILDDAFQHRRVKPSFQVLLTDYHRPFYNDYVIPGGYLRESRRGAARADVIVVTKCPSLTTEAMTHIEGRIARYSAKPVFFAGIRYGTPVPVFPSHEPVGDQVVLVTGIGHAKPLVTYVRDHFRLVKHFDFPDHHAYTREDLRTIMSAVTPGCMVLTTEKDKTKIKLAAAGTEYERLPVFYLPMELYFLKRGEAFEAMVFRAIDHREHR